MVILTANRLTAKKQIAMAHFFVFMDLLRYHGRTRSFEEKSFRVNKDGLSFLFHQTKAKCFRATQSFAPDRNEEILLRPANGLR